MGFKEVASSPLLYALVSGMVLYLLVYSTAFMYRGYKRCLELGISKKVTLTAIRSSVLFSIVPSFAIVVAFFSLAAAFGVPWPWLRLTVVGGVPYELMSADMACKSMGYTSLSAMAAANDGRTFGAIMFVMTLGILSSIITLLLVGKKMQSGLQTVGKKNSEWGTLLNASFSITMMCVFFPLLVAAGPVLILTLLTSATVTIVCGMLVKKFHIAWLVNFTTSFALIIAMASSVLWTNLLS